MVEKPLGRQTVPSTARVACMPSGLALGTQHRQQQQPLFPSALFGGTEPTMELATQQNLPKACGGLCQAVHLGVSTQDPRPSTADSTTGNQESGMLA